VASRSHGGVDFADIQYQYPMGRQNRERTMPFVKTGDITTHYEQFGTGKPVVFAHGLAGHCEREADWAKMLSGRGYSAIVYSVRGHGKSTPCDDPSKYRFDVLAGDLEHFLDTLGIDRCIVGGGSMGAAITLTFALRNPERVAGLIQLMPAFGSAPNQMLVDGFAAVAQVVYSRGAEEAVRLLFQALEPLAAQERAQPGFMQDLIDQWSSHDPASLATAMRAIPAQSPFESIDDLTSLELPVLVVAGHDDPIHPLAVAKAYCRRLPDCRLVCVRSTAQMRERPAAIASLVAHFADSCT
jgi:pimeloyl-ACP methyl ester carboxylesterase